MFPSNKICSNYFVLEYTLFRYFIIYIKNQRILNKLLIAQHNMADYEALKVKLTADLRRLSDGAQVDSSGVGSELALRIGRDEGDQAAYHASTELNVAVAEARQALSEQASIAREKVSIGTYGKCEYCGDPISEERLEALPSATLCIGCKSEEERAQMRQSQPYEARRNHNPLPRTEDDDPNRTLGDIIRNDSTLGDGGGID